jgi:hypothetical protein
VLFRELGDMTSNFIARTAGRSTHPRLPWSEFRLAQVKQELSELQPDEAAGRFENKDFR